MTTHDPASSADPSGYRPVSRLAVAAVVLGGVSGLALISPVFGVLPLVAAAVAVAALADVGRPGAAKAGRLAALAGLALASGFGAQALTAAAVGRSIAARRAATVAEIFLAAVREGRAADAAAMCGPEAGAGVSALAACGGGVLSRTAAAGDGPGRWVVELEPAEQGGCAARLVIEPTSVVLRGTPVERWLVTGCDVDGPPVRPSGR